MKHLLLFMVIIGSLCFSTCLSEMTELDIDKLMLLNVAVKGQLVNKLATTISTMQSTRKTLVGNVQDCLIKVSASQALCKKCVRDKCEKRAAECRLSVDRLDTVLLNDERSDVSPLEFISPNNEITEGIELLTGEARGDILAGIPQELREEAEKLVDQEHTQSKLQILKNHLIKTVEGLPKLIPKVKEAIDDFNTHIENPETIDSLANNAAKQVAFVMEGEQLAKKGQDMLNEHLPRIMSSVQDQMSRMMSSFGKFIKSANEQIGSMTAKSGGANGKNELPEFINMPQQQGSKFSDSVVSIHIINPDGKVSQWKNNQQSASGNDIPQSGTSQREDMSTSQDVPFHKGIMSALESSINQALESAGGFISKNIGNLQTHVIGGSIQPLQIKPHVIGGSIQPLQMKPTPNTGPSNRGVPSGIQRSRARRSIHREARCNDIVDHPHEACKNYHFQCSTCLNESVLLQHACGKDALKTMVDIKQTDLKMAAYLVAYGKDVKNGLIVKKVIYDKASYNQGLKRYQSAYVTAKIGKRMVTYETSSLPKFSNLVASGGEIGEEIWQILEAGDEFQPDQFVNKWTPDDHASMAIKDTGKSSAAVTSVVWSVMATVMYMGFQAI